MVTWPFEEQNAILSVTVSDGEWENGCVFVWVEVFGHHASQEVEICACMKQVIAFFQLGSFFGVLVTLWETVVVSLLGKENDPGEKVGLDFASVVKSRSVFGAVKLTFVWPRTMEIADELVVVNHVLHAHLVLHAHHGPVADLHP